VGDTLRPLYVSRWPQGALQPIACQNVNGYLFLLRGQRANLQDLCDRFLNVPSAGSGWTYRALTDLVILTLDRTQKLIPQNPPGSNVGWTPETEASLWVPTVAMRNDLGIEVADHLAFFVPYIFVEEWLAIMGGREVYGFPKEQAWMDIPTDPTTASHLSADVVGTRVFGPDSEMTRMNLLDVDRVDGSTAPPVPAQFAEVLELVEQEIRANLVIPSPALIVHLLQDLANKQLTLVFLKQLFDAEDGRFACYQAIIEAPVQITRDPVMQRLSSDFQVSWQELATHPVQQDLGLPLQQQALRVYSIDFDFAIENGKVVWQAP
jgi:hypothetical protein